MTARALMVAAVVIPAAALGVALGVVLAVAGDRLAAALGEPIEWEGVDDG